MKASERHIVMNLLENMIYTIPQITIQWYEKAFIRQEGLAIVNIVFKTLPIICMQCGLVIYHFSENKILHPLLCTL